MDLVFPFLRIRLSFLYKCLVDFLQNKIENKILAIFMKLNTQQWNKTINILQNQMYKIFKYLLTLCGHQNCVWDWDVCKECMSWLSGWACQATVCEHGGPGCHHWLLLIFMGEEKNLFFRGVNPGKKLLNYQCYNRSNLRTKTLDLNSIHSSRWQTKGMWSNWQQFR